MTRKKKNTKLNKETRKNIEGEILELLDNNPDRIFSQKQIQKRLGIRNKSARQFMGDVMHGLESSGAVEQVNAGKYITTKKPETFVGKVDHVNPRFAYIVVDEESLDIKVSSINLGNALDGDLVKVTVHKPEKRGRHPEGKVVEILERKRNNFVGRIEVFPNYAFVIPDNKKIYIDIFIPKDQIGKAKHNYKVIAEIKEWPSLEKNPVGRITEVLGEAGDHEAEIHSIIAEFGLPYKFSKRITKAANAISENITPREINKRRDFRQVITFTIDPEDAKDFDDALSFEKLENGNYEIGIHIADVTHYVKKDSLLEQEALDRATSVYLVDRTIPMLPEKLSNKICSLRPKEDKLTYSAVFEIDKNAKVKGQWFGRTIIHSDRRFTYEEAQARLDKKQGDYADELNTLNELAKKIRVRRFRNGAMNFETIEVKFELDEKGVPLRIVPKDRKDAHKLIEEFMLLANKKVAEYAFEKSKKGKSPFVYRTHDDPDPEKLSTFANFAKQFGYELNLDKGSLSQKLNQLIQDIENKPEQNVLESVAIRAMAKAKYTTETKRHFGLAFKHYTHFTSPIRRYPDMMVHRLLTRYLQNENLDNSEEYEDQCLHSSEMEKRAADAERASIKYKQVEFMQLAEDKVYQGIVSGVTEWGIFVEIIETKCEGMVRLAEMYDDYYQFDEKNFRVIGAQNKKIIQLGDNVEVRVVDTDIDRRTIDLVFA